MIYLRLKLHFREIVDKISEYNLLQDQNIDKLQQYFGSKECCHNFKNEFFEISDYEKNDTLYLNNEEDSNDQYFVLLTLVPVDEAQDEEVDCLWTSYTSKKASKMLAHKRLVKSLRLKIKNYLLILKTKNSYSKNRNLTVNEYNWIGLGGNYYITQLIRESCINEYIFEAIERLYNLQNQLMNILNNHYTIRNSLDTHFVVTKIDEIEKTLIDANVEISRKIIEIENSKVKF